MTSNTQDKLLPALKGATKQSKSFSKQKPKNQKSQNVTNLIYHTILARAMMPWMLGALGVIQSQYTAPESRLSKYRARHNTWTPTDGRAEGKNESRSVRVSKELAHEVPGVTAGPPEDSRIHEEEQNSSSFLEG